MRTVASVGSGGREAGVDCTRRGKDPVGAGGSGGGGGGVSEEHDGFGLPWARIKRLNHYSEQRGVGLEGLAA